MKNTQKLSAPRSPKILWAMDPLAEDDFGLAAGAHSAAALARMWNRPVEPVSIVSTEDLSGITDFSGEWSEKSIPQLKESLSEKARQFGERDFLEPKILVSNESGKRKEIKALLKYAKKNGPAPLVLTTHGRTGFGRLMLGSFAETALLEAKTPLLIVAPDHELKEVKTALFPTNFSRASKLFIKRQIPWLRENGIKVVVYHKLINAVDPFIQSGMTIAGGGWVSFQSMMQEETLKRQKDGDRLCAELSKEGIVAKFVMGESTDSLEHGVLEAVQTENVDLIALLTESDALNANLVGSLARQLSRSAPCPLWIQHK